LSFGLYAEAPLLPGAGEFALPLPGVGELALSTSGVVEVGLPSLGARETALSRIAPLLTAGLLGVVVALMLVVSVAAPR
jgi:hypothetical protein